MSSFETIEFQCNLCSGLVHSISRWSYCDHLDGAKYHCQECGAAGEFSVDYDEQAFTCVWTAYPDEKQSPEWLKANPLPEEPDSEPTKPSWN